MSNLYLIFINKSRPKNYFPDTFKSNEQSKQIRRDEFFDLRSSVLSDYIK